LVANLTPLHSDPQNAYNGGLAGHHVRKEVEVITPTNVARMLENALQDDLGLVPFLALGFFTGIRPEEIRLMHWGDIDIPSKGITIRPEVSKTHKRRFPVLSDNAVAWLEA
jgi:integrase